MCKSNDVLFLRAGREAACNLNPTILLKLQHVQYMPSFVKTAHMTFTKLELSVTSRHVLLWFFVTYIKKSRRRSVSMKHFMI